MEPSLRVGWHTTAFLRAVQNQAKRCRGKNQRNPCASCCWNVDYIEWRGPVVRISLKLEEPHGPKKHSTYSTYSTFQQKAALFRTFISNIIQHIQRFSRKKSVKFAECKKCAFHDVLGGSFTKKGDPISVVFLSVCKEKRAQKSRKQFCDFSPCCLSFWGEMGFDPKTVGTSSVSLHICIWGEGLIEHLPFEVFFREMGGGRCVSGVPNF